MEKLKILAIDDNIVNLATIEQELKYKYDVVPMSSGSRAIRYLNKEKADLVLLDIQMALMDGIETLRQMRTMENGATIPVIFLTSQKDKETVIEGSKLGIMDYIVKPFDPTDLHERIERALKKVGTLPFENREVYDKVVEIREYIAKGDIKSALIRTDELLTYRIDEEISERMRSVKAKLKAEEIDTAERMADRVLGMIGKTVVLNNHTEKRAINMGELNTRLLHILYNLSNYKAKEAAAKLDELLEFRMPAMVEEACMQARDKLDEYDDGAAEIIIRDALSDMKNQTL